MLGDAVLRAEGRVSVVDACLAAAFQVNLALNAGRGGWSADSAAGRVVVFYGAAGPSTPSSARRPAPDVVAGPAGRPRQPDAYLVLLWRWARRHPDTVTGRVALRLLPDLLRLIRRLAADRAVPPGVALVLRSVACCAGPAALERHWPGTPERLHLIVQLAGLPEASS